jgi:uridylate kinase
MSAKGGSASGGKKEIIVISLGGSLIVPAEIDHRFLKNFRKLILAQIRQGKKFILICGGGKTARNYQAAAKKISPLNDNDIDWLGIHATRLNAHLLRSIFVKVAHKTIIKPLDKIDFKESVLIAAGWKPGNSTDYCAVLLAEKYKAKKILNLSNIDYVFNRDPRKDKNAKPLEKTSWRDFRRLIPKKWSPGLNSPFDPVASRAAQNSGLEVAIINGRNFKSIGDYLAGKKFKGTMIS